MLRKDISGKAEGKGIEREIGEQISIVRGKVKAPAEFGAKFDLSLDSE